MSKTLLAALLLLIISGGGAALSWYATSTGADDPQSVLAQGGSPATPTSDLDESTPVTSTPEQEPATATATVADTTPAPDAPSPTPTAEIPSDLPAAPTGSSEPTQASSAASDDPPTPQWSLVQPARWAPTQLRIPDIGVDAQVVGVAQTDTGAMEAPADYGEVGWYRLGAKPGDPGRAVLAGHVDSKTGPAVFYKLRDLVPGSVIEVSLGNGAETLRYVVSGTARYPEHEAPLDRIFGPAEHSELVLITCAGDFDFSAGAYPDRLVIYADLAPQ